MAGFDETQHPRGAAGQFREKTNSAPASGLGIGGEDRAGQVRTAHATAESIGEIAAAFEHAAKAARRAESLLKVREQYPWVTKASVHHNRIHLQATKPDGRVRAESVDATSRMCATIGYGDVDLEAAAETPAPHSLVAAALGKMSFDSRSLLDEQLSEMDGRAASMFDTSEVARYVEYLGEDDAFMAGTFERLAQRHGDIETVAKEMAETDAWWRYRESVADFAHEERTDMIERAAIELLAKGEHR